MCNKFQFNLQYKLVKLVIIQNTNYLLIVNIIAVLLEVVKMYFFKKNIVYFYQNDIKLENTSPLHAKI